MFPFAVSNETFGYLQAVNINSTVVFSWVRWSLMGFLEHPPDQRGVSCLSNAVHLQHFAFGVSLSPSWPPAALNALMLLPGPIIIINACPVIINKVHPPRIRESERTRKTAISWHCVSPGQAGKTRQGEARQSGLISKPGKPCKQLLPLLPLLLLLPDPVLCLLLANYRQFLFSPNSVNFLVFTFFLHGLTLRGMCDNILSVFSADGQPPTRPFFPREREREMKTSQTRSISSVETPDSCDNMAGKRNGKTVNREREGAGKGTQHWEQRRGNGNSTDNGCYLSGFCWPFCHFPAGS